MSDTDLEWLNSQLCDPDALVREAGCEAIPTGGDLRCVEYLIRILKDDPSDAVRYDAEQALTRLCFTRSRATQSRDSIANWWMDWWSEHSAMSSAELLSQTLAKYLLNVADGDDDALEEEITLNLAFDSTVSVPSLWKDKQRHIAEALVDAIAPSGGMELMAKRLVPFARCILKCVSARKV